MVEIAYDKLLEKVSKASGLEREDIERRIDAKRAKLSGLISKEGAAQVVAAELGVSFDHEKMKLDEVISGMRKVNVLAKVIKLFPVRSFSKNGKDGKVANLIVADDTSNVKVVLWDTNHIELLEKKEVVEGSVIEINNASTRGNEIHLGSFSDFKLSKEIIDNVRTEKMFREKELSDFKISDNAKTRAFIVQAFEPKIFFVCPECKRKAVMEDDQYSCGTHGKVQAEKRALMNIVIDDGTETVRAVLFNDSLKLLGIENLDDMDEISKQKEQLLGKEMVFSGDVKLNQFFNNPEFVVERIDESDVDELLAKLEN